MSVYGMLGWLMLFFTASLVVLAFAEGDAGWLGAALVTFLAGAVFGGVDEVVRSRKERS